MAEFESSNSNSSSGGGGGGGGGDGGASGASAAMPPSSTAAKTNPPSSSWFPVPNRRLINVGVRAYTEDPSRIVTALGGEAHISDVWQQAEDIAAGKHIKERDGRMEMRLRPEDPECHPILADREPSCCLLLRVTPGAPGEEELEASVIGVATHEYNFKGEWLLTMFA